MHVLKADNMTIKNIDFMYLPQRMNFLHDVFQMTTIALASVINHYHINGLLLFGDTLFFYITRIILFAINHLFANSEVVTSIAVKH